VIRPCEVNAGLCARSEYGITSQPIHESGPKHRRGDHVLAKVNAGEHQRNSTARTQCGDQTKIGIGTIREVEDENKILSFHMTT
jgi:hypothetical protein